MKNATLYVVCAVSNPIRWASRIALARSAIASWLTEPNVHVTIVECAYGARAYDLADLASARVQHVPVRATTMAWSKESCLNIGIAHLPQEAAYIATLDADISFRKAGWATETLHALQLYPVVQPWVNAYDLGPNDSHIQTHVSFCYCYDTGSPVIPDKAKFWKFCGGPYDYPHSGFAWGYTRDILNRLGGLFEVGGMGSGDHHMALSFVGGAASSMPGGVSDAYKAAVEQWQSRALLHANKKIGYVPGTIEHQWHGSKAKRAYIDRWGMFVKHGFDPWTDLKRNTYGVLEFSGNKPDLEREFANYLRSREEDATTL